MWWCSINNTYNLIKKRIKWTGMSLMNSWCSLCVVTIQDDHWMGKGPQLSAVQPGQDGGHTIRGSESESGLPVPLLSSGRLRTSRHHHWRQVSAVCVFSHYCSAGQFCDSLLLSHREITMSSMDIYHNDTRITLLPLLIFYLCYLYFIFLIVFYVLFDIVASITLYVATQAATMFGLHWNVLTTIWLIARTFYTDIHGPITSTEFIHPTDF